MKQSVSQTEKRLVMVLPLPEAINLRLKYYRTVNNDRNLKIAAIRLLDQHLPNLPKPGKRHAA